MLHQKIAVCDDEKASLLAIKKAVVKNFAQYGVEVEISIFQSAELLMKSMGTDSYNCCFLDIDMPEINGIDFADEICRKHTNLIIVFVSAKEEYVFQSFRVHPFSFVRKSCFAEDIGQTIKDMAKLLYKQDTQNQSCRIKDSLGYEHIFLLDSVCYLESEEKYVRVVLINREKLLRCSMKSLEKELESYGLIRCHKSYIVNIKKVYAVKHDHLILLDGKRLPIRRGMVTELKKQLCGLLVQ